MIFHYFKVAFRSYINNKIQSAITLFSMAIAFALASIAAYWIHYEKTYDSFIADSERIYMIGQKIPERTSINSISFYGLHSHLMNNFPEVDKVCGIKTKWKADRTVAINKQIVLAGCEEITPETIEMFDIQWVDGNRDMNSWKENEVAVSEQIVRQTCGKDSPIGEKLVLLKDDGMEIAGEYQIAAVFKTWPQHSNFNFQILKKYVPTTSVYKVNTCYAYVCLKPDTDVDLFLNKMIANPFINELGIKKLQNVLVPLSELHYTVFGRNQDIRLNDVKLFAGAAMLLSVCALLNYLTLFVSRLRNRGRDMALRTICGSSSWQTGILLMVEYLFLLLGALILSIFFIELFYNVFVKLSQLDVDRITVYAGCGYLLLFILILAVVLSFVPILYFKNKTLRGQIDSTPVRLGRNRFRIAGVCMQLFISLLFIFCSTVMIKQIHYLIHADINIERKNIAWIVAPFSEDVVMSTLKQIPSITKMVGVSTPLFPANNRTESKIQGFEGCEDIIIPAVEFFINQDIAQFYGLKMKEGAESFDLKMDEVLINETFAKQLGVPNPIGKIFPHIRKNMVIKGIVHDFQYQNPTKPAPALYFLSNIETKSKYYNCIAFRYTGDFSDCQATIKKTFEKVEPDLDDPDALKVYNRQPIRIEDGETVYNGYLTSEFNLLKLLNIITFISLLIALFGVYALILQECERQRKNIAIRKVYGAQVKDILMMFFKEYIMQVAIAAIFAFPIGYVLIKHWLESYSRQTSIGVGVFLGIFIGMVTLVMLCIGWHVWRAANENPAIAVKKRIKKT